MKIALQSLGIIFLVILLLGLFVGNFVYDETGLDRIANSIGILSWFFLSVGMFFMSKVLSVIEKNDEEIKLISLQKKHIKLQNELLKKQLAKEIDEDEYEDTVEVMTKW